MKHLYNLIFILTFLVTNYSVSQNLNDIKKDSIVKIDNTDLSLIYYKKTTAVWHNFASFYVVEPTKNWFIYLNSVQLLVEVDYKHKTFFAVIEDELTGGYKRFLIGENDIHGDIIYAQTLESRNSDVKEYKEYIQIDSLYFSKSLKEVITPLDSFKVGEYSLSFDKKLIFKTDFIYAYELKPYPLLQAIESIQYPGEDSITIDSDVVYFPWPIKEKLSKSGIYSLKKREWLLPQVFNTIDHSKSELITNPISMDLRELNSQIWRNKFCKWELKSVTYSSIKKAESVYICTTQLDKYGQVSYLVLGKDLKPIEINDFYNFDFVEAIKDGVKITPILTKPTSTFVLDFKGNIINSDN